LLAMSSAATASRTGAVQWLLILGLMFCWRVFWGRLVLGLGLVGLILYGAAAWLLPRLLLDWTGFAWTDCLCASSTKSRAAPAAVCCGPMCCT